MNIKKIETNIKRNLFLHETDNINFFKSPKTLENRIITIKPNITFQKFLGFGGAFTESSGYSLSTVNNNIYSQIIDEYYSKIRFKL